MKDETERLLQIFLENQLDDHHIDNKRLTAGGTFRAVCQLVDDTKAGISNVKDQIQIFGSLIIGCLLVIIHLLWK